MELIVKVTSPGLRTPLADLLRLPLGLDVWEVKPDHLILRAAEPQIDRLARMGYGVEQLQDVETHLRAFATAEAVSGYHSAASLEQELRQLADARPDIAELREIGRSIEGRAIHVLRIGERNGGQTPKILFMGCHHAREWIAVEVPFLLAKELVERADDPQVAGWLSRAEIWVAPMVNPDGHEHSRVEQRLWRKNRRPNRDGSIGVDPNRNYGYMWGTLNVPTSSHVPSDETYVGPRAFSEPETQAVRDLVACERFAGVITYHSYSQLILYPWGYTERPVPDERDLELMVDLATEMQALIRRRPWRRLHAAAVIRALPDGRRYHRLDLWHLRHPLVHDRAAPAHLRGGRLHPAGQPDPADLGGEPPGCVSLHRAADRGAGRLISPHRLVAPRQEHALFCTYLWEDGRR